MRDAEQPLLDGGVGHDHRVVLVLAHRRLALARQHADHAKRLIANADDGAGRIGAGAEQLIAHDRPEHGDLGRARHVLRGEEAAELQRPGTQGRQFIAGALHLRVPVAALGHDLRAQS